MHGFVEGVICVLARHASADQYYAAASARRHIPAIKTPTLFLASSDDPFLGAVPAEEVAANPHTLLALTARSCPRSQLPRGSILALLCGPAWRAPVLVPPRGQDGKRLGTLLTCMCASKHISMRRAGVHVWVP